ncbi:hypothetical protein A6A08_05325 [Nocardiopsis sp. TSRI0078]|uniref:aggregation-promoting factor C-terminal-like domain-containing protein n=1 Tax=unclassified Nocardiopsis TaxID=2649073 RepID=UPI00093E4B58|nr:hypothetical protein [Nocardiopsis sp. TSRI0078]OKI19019.1 hypothetical protein A6A08_05325 [Nocardiopsis sp. TSRI0078]
MPTSHRPALGDTRRPSPTGPPRRSDDRNGPPRVRRRTERVLRLLRPAKGATRDRGAAFVELAAVTVLVAAIMVAVYQLELSQTFNNGVRQMVCLVEGPDCGDQTWVDADRPEEPEEYEWGAGGSNALENESLAMEMAAARDWNENERTCLKSLWNAMSHWDHTFVDTETGAHGISGFNPARHGPMPTGFRESPSEQISWGLGYIEQTYGSPCAAWVAWEDTHTY